MRAQSSSASSFGNTHASPSGAPASSLSHPYSSFFNQPSPYANKSQRHGMKAPVNGVSAAPSHANAGSSGSSLLQVKSKANSSNGFNGNAGQSSASASTALVQLQASRRFAPSVAPSSISAQSVARTNATASPYYHAAESKSPLISQSQMSWDMQPSQPVKPLSPELYSDHSKEFTDGGMRMQDEDDDEENDDEKVFFDDVFETAASIHSSRRRAASPLRAHASSLRMPSHHTQQLSDPYASNSFHTPMSRREVESQRAQEAAAASFDGQYAKQNAMQQDQAMSAMPMHAPFTPMHMPMPMASWPDANVANQLGMQQHPFNPLMYSAAAMASQMQMQNMFANMPNMLSQAHGSSHSSSKREKSKKRKKKSKKESDTSSSSSESEQEISKTKSDKKKTKKIASSSSPSALPKPVSSVPEVSTPKATKAPSSTKPTLDVSTSSNNAGKKENSKRGPGRPKKAKQAAQSDKETSGRAEAANEVVDVPRAPETRATRMISQFSALVNQFEASSAPAPGASSSSSTSPSLLEDSCSTSGLSYELNPSILSLHHHLASTEPQPLQLLQWLIQNIVLKQSALQMTSAAEVSALISVLAKLISARACEAKQSEACESMLGEMKALIEELLTALLSLSIDKRPEKECSGSPVALHSEAIMLSLQALISSASLITIFTLSASLKRLDQALNFLISEFDNALTPEACMSTLIAQIDRIDACSSLLEIIESCVIAPCDHTFDFPAAVYREMTHCQELLERITRASLNAALAQFAPMLCAGMWHIVALSCELDGSYHSVLRLLALPEKEKHGRNKRDS